jgi:hypothetical protein
MIVARHEVPGKSVYRKNRPVGYSMIGRSYPRHPRGISRRRCAPCFLRKAIYFVFEISSLQIKIGAHACTNQTVPYGTKPFAHRRARIKSALWGFNSGNRTQVTEVSSVRAQDRAQASSHRNAAARRIRSMIAFPSPISGTGSIKIWRMSKRSTSLSKVNNL